MIMVYRKKDEDGFNTDFLRKQARKGAVKKTFQQKTSGFGGTTKPKLRVSAPTITPNLTKSYTKGLKKLKRKEAMESIKATPKRMSTRTLARNHRAISKAKNRWDRY